MVWGEMAVTVLLMHCGCSHTAACWAYKRYAASLAFDGGVNPSKPKLAAHLNQQAPEKPPLVLLWLLDATADMQLWPLMLAGLVLLLGAALDVLRCSLQHIHSRTQQQHQPSQHECAPAACLQLRPHPAAEQGEAVGVLQRMSHEFSVAAEGGQHASVCCPS